MRDVSARAAGQASVHRLRVLGIAALTVIIAGFSNAGHAAAGLWLHDAARDTGVHQAASPYEATPSTENTLGACLLGPWLHSWEEDTGATIVYRPADYPFGPSRGRDGYEFQAGGNLVYHGFGPADGPLTSAGAWAWLAPDQIHITVNDPLGASIDETLHIVACDEASLQVERVVDENA